MKRAALIIVFVYGLILLAFTLPAITLSFWGTETEADSMAIFGQAYYWAWLIIMMAGQAAFLVVPVRAAGNRPVTRKSLIWPVAAASLAMGILMAGFVFVVGELISNTPLNRTTQFIALAELFLMWLLWALIFSRWSAGEDKRSFIKKLRRAIYIGSILELFIAVPSHLIARQRTYCCAGADTFIGLAFGFSVMLFSFGPGIFFLYADRIKNLKTKKSR